MNVIDLSLLACFEHIMMLTLIHRFVPNIKTRFSSKVIVILAGQALVILLNHLELANVLGHTISVIILFGVYMVYISRYHQDSFMNNVITYILALSTGVIIQLLSMIFLLILLPDFEQNIVYGALTLLLSYSLILLLKKRWYIFMNNYISSKSMGIKQSMIVMFMLYFVLTSLWYIDTESLINSLSSMIIIVIFSSTIYIVIFNEGVKEIKHNAVLAVYDRYLPIIDGVIEEYRNSKHDLHNHLQTIYSLSSLTPDIGPFATAYEKSLEENKIWGELFKIKDKVILAFFYSKYKEALNNNIDIEINIRPHKRSGFYKTYELVEMYGIAIDNAMEACEERRQVIFNMYEECEMIVFEVLNTHTYISTNEIAHFFKKGYSTKLGNNRGLGLAKLTKMLEKSDSKLEMSFLKNKSSVYTKITHH